MLKKRLSFAIFTASIIFFTVCDTHAAPLQVKRLWGTDRHQILYTETDKEILKGLVSDKQSKNIVNTVGNTSGNTVNYGRYAVQGKWAYYSNFDDGNKLYKMKIDGTESIKLSEDNAEFINVVGDWIYYVTYQKNKSYINKIKIDGSGEVTLFSAQSYLRFLNVYKDKIYYLGQGSNSEANNWYYSVNALNINGDSLGEVYRFPRNSSQAYFNVVANYGYCLVNEYGNKDIIYKFSLDGSEQFTRLAKNALTFNVVGDWVYYGTSGRINEIRKVKIDGAEDQKLTDGFPGGLHQWGDASCLNVEGNWIYYKDWYDQAIYKVDVNGNNKTKLTDCAAESISIVGDYLYCPEYGIDNTHGEFYEYKNMKKIKK